jgi:hypothetical protein
MSPREQRAIRNEDLFREVNVHIFQLEEKSRGPHSGELLPLICECTQSGCNAPIEVDPHTFQWVRESALRFLVAVGHEQLDVETVIGRREGYLIVEKNS